MSFVDIFGWQFSVVISEGNKYYLVDDNMFNLLGFASSEQHEGTAFLKNKSVSLDIEGMWNSYTMYRWC